MVSRADELKKGIRIFDEMNNEVGKSKIAAWTAVMKTSMTRVILAF